MDPREAYRQTYSSGWNRADMLLALLDGACERLELAAAALGGNDRLTALRLLTRAELIVCALAGGIDPAYELAPRVLRLYGLASQAISAATAEQTDVALRILRALREGVERNRDEAVRLEREGVVPPLRDPRLVHATA
jgi:flagellar secretion chaperone FliS